MKKQIFAAFAAVCLMAGTSVMAQQPQKQMTRERPTAEQIAKRQTERMTERLKLTDTQAKEVYSYNLERAKQMEAQQGKMADARKANEAKIQKILTPEQFTQWQESQRHMQHMNKGGMKGKAACAQSGSCDKDKKSCCKGESTKECCAGKSCGDKK